MAGKYNNGNTRFTDDELMAIYRQFNIIDEQVRVMKDSKKEMLKKIGISTPNYYLRIKSFKERGLIK